MKQKKKCFFICVMLSIFILLLVSCGERKNPIDGVNYYFVGYVYSEMSYDENGDAVNIPIPDIKVTSNYGETKTNSEGRFAILSYGTAENTWKHLITFEDVDGEMNGSFETLSEFYDSHRELEILLNRK